MDHPKPYVSAIVDPVKGALRGKRGIGADDTTGVLSLDGGTRETEDIRNDGEEKAPPVIEVTAHQAWLMKVH
jgi:hypothetical protein